MPQPIKTAFVLEEVSEWFDLPIKTVTGSKRSKSVVNARCVAMYLLRQHTSMSLPEIGEIFARDHTTVMAALRRMEKLLESRLWQADYEEIERTVVDRSFANTAKG